MDISLYHHRTASSSEGRITCVVLLCTLQARLLYPGVPVEVVVSIGTGYHKDERKADVYGWEGKGHIRTSAYIQLRTGVL